MNTINVEDSMFLEETAQFFDTWRGLVKLSKTLSVIMKEAVAEKSLSARTTTKLNVITEGLDSMASDIQARLEDARKQIEKLAEKFAEI